MKNFTIIISLFLSLFSYSQKEGQIFCDGDPSETYFPLLDSKKHLVWQDTYYTEEFIGKKMLNNKTYKEYKQSWELGYEISLFLREEKGVIYQFEETQNDDSIRLPKKPKKGKTWKTSDSLASYEIVSLKGKLKTPFCTYKNLLVLKSIFKSETFFNNTNYLFYYQKGYGYIGATQNGELISFASPVSPIKLRNQ